MIDEIDAETAWRMLQEDPRAQLCDVRTDAEWTFVGFPDLQQLGREPLLIPWQLYPGMQRNGAFMEGLAATEAEHDAPLIFLCRSGARSLAAAQAAKLAGYAQVFNVVDGFEGPVDTAGHRGKLRGWKAAGLPWRQG